MASNGKIDIFQQGIHLQRVHFPASHVSLPEGICWKFVMGPYFFLCMRDSVAFAGETSSLPFENISSICRIHPNYCFTSLLMPFCKALWFWSVISQAMANEWSTSWWFCIIQGFLGQYLYFDAQLISILLLQSTIESCVYLNHINVMTCSIQVHCWRLPMELFFGVNRTPSILPLPEIRSPHHFHWTVRSWQSRIIFQVNLGAKWRDRHHRWLPF